MDKETQDRCRLAGSLSMLPKAIESAEQVLSTMRTIDRAIHELSPIKVDDLEGLRKDVHDELFEFLENKARGIASTDSIQSQAKRLTDKIMQHVEFYSSEENQSRELDSGAEMAEHLS